MNLKHLLLISIAFFASLNSRVGYTDEVDLGALIARCSECHTEKGLAGIPGWPSIAGMEKNLIIGKLKGHRAGLINDSTMKKVAHDLSDEEIEAVAEHFSTMLPVEN